jgi:hypothetical protein
MAGKKFKVMVAGKEVMTVKAYGKTQAENKALKYPMVAQAMLKNFERGRRSGGLRIEEEKT